MEADLYPRIDNESDIAWRALCERYSGVETMILVGDGYSLPDGTFPIVDEADLWNAIKAYSYAEKPIATRRHICRRAGELGLETPIGFCHP